MRRIRRMTTRTANSLLWTVLTLITVLTWMAPSAPAQSRGQAGRESNAWRQKDTEWASYSADVKGTRYRPLDRINAANFNQLEIAWRFKTDSLRRFRNTSWKARR
jgi:glucose dehydrogenase